MSSLFGFRVVINVNWICVTVWRQIVSVVCFSVAWIINSGYQVFWNEIFVSWQIAGAIHHNYFIEIVATHADI